MTYTKIKDEIIDNRVIDIYNYIISMLRNCFILTSISIIFYQFSHSFSQKKYHRLSVILFIYTFIYIIITNILVIRQLYIFFKNKIIDYDLYLLSFTSIFYLIVIMIYIYFLFTN